MGDQSGEAAEDWHCLFGYVNAKDWFNGALQLVLGCVVLVAVLVAGMFTKVCVAREPNRPAGGDRRPPAWRR